MEERNTGTIDFIWQDRNWCSTSRRSSAITDLTSVRPCLLLPFIFAIKNLSSLGPNWARALECLRVKSFSIRNNVTRTRERQGYIRHVGQYSTIRRAVPSCCIPFSRAYSCALYKIYPRVVVTQLFRSPRWISMKTHGANVGPTRRSKRRSRPKTATVGHRHVVCGRC